MLICSSSESELTDEIFSGGGIKASSAILNYPCNMISNIKMGFSLRAAQDAMALGGGTCTTSQVVLQIHVCPALPKKLHTHSSHDGKQRDTLREQLVGNN